MIRKTTHILIIITVFILLTSKSCESVDDLDKDARISAKQDSLFKEIKDVFESEYLFEEELMAYGEKAKQKVLDFTDYMSLYSEKEMDPLFKQQVKDMVFNLFNNNDPIVQLPVIPTERAGNKKDCLSDLLITIDALKYQSIDFAIDGLKIVEPLHLEDVKRYVGKLECNFNISGITENDTTLLYKTSNQVSFITYRAGKQFGTDNTLLVWQVFLIGIETIN